VGRETECSKMALSTDGHSDDVSCRVTYMSTGSPNRPNTFKSKKLNDPWANKADGQVADLKKRIPVLKRLIADCGRLAAELDQDVRNEEDRVRIHDPAHSAYSIYARATASRRDNLRRSSNELGDHLAKAERALLDLGESIVDT
jgi:hypothetical protein